VEGGRPCVSPHVPRVEALVVVADEVAAQVVLGWWGAPGPPADESVHCSRGVEGGGVSRGAVGTAGE